MSIRVLTQGSGAGGASASIFVKGLSETDSVKAVHSSGKTVGSKWVVRTVKEERSIPNMTSNDLPLGKATCSSSFSDNYDAYRAFTDNMGNGWAPKQSDSYGDAYCQYEFDVPIKPDCIGITNCSSGFWFTYKVLASLNGSAWDTLVESFTDASGGGVFKEIPIVTEKSYKYFRLILVSGSYPSPEASEGHKMQVYGTADVVQTCYHEIPKINKYGTWTVEATNGEQTTTQDVLVDAAMEYEIEMDLYKLWLYSNGEVNESVGLTVVPTPRHGSGEIVNTGEYYRFGATSAGALKGAVLFSSGLLDLTPYTKLILKAKHDADTTTNSTVELGISSIGADAYAQSGSFTNIITQELPYTSSSEIVKYTLDISSVDSGYVMVNAWGSVCYMYEFGLE